MANVLNSGRSAPLLTDQHHLLSPEGHYLCPVCRHGYIAQLTLMDAFACSFCRHIFDVSYSEQLVRVVDGPHPTAWRWLGDRWSMLGRRPATLSIWLISLILALVPFTLISVAGYIFPPLPNSRWAWIPAAWALGTLAAHSILAAWIIVEYHQPPFYTANKIRFHRWLQRS